MQCDSFLEQIFLFIVKVLNQMQLFYELEVLVLRTNLVLGLEAILLTIIPNYFE